MAFELQAKGALITVSGMAFEASIAHGKNIAALYGLNPQKLVAEIERAAEKGAAGILSFGTAAGLDPSLAPGTIIIAREMRLCDEIYTVDAAWAQRLSHHLPDAVCATIAAVEQPVAGIAEKTLLHRNTNAVAADMESHLAARMAQRFHLPFAALRVVLDDAHTALPPAAFYSMRPNGTVNYGGLLLSLLQHPVQLPAMLRLATHHKAAKRSLLRCGNLKSSLFGLMDLG